MPRDALAVSQGWQFSHKPAYVVQWRGEPLYGDTRAQLRCAARHERMLEFEVQHVANQQHAKAKEQRKQRGEKLPHGGNAAELQEMKVNLRQRMEEKDEFDMARLWDPILKSKTVAEAVLKVKIIAGVLATQASHAHRGMGGDCQ